MNECNVANMISKTYEDVSDIMATILAIRYVIVSFSYRVFTLHSPESEVQAIKDFRLSIAETLLASTTFNGKMNALKEVCLISEIFELLTLCRFTEYARMCLITRATTPLSRKRW